MKDLNSFQPAYQETFAFYEENLHMLNWYAKRIIKSFIKERFSSLLSLGIGYEIVNQNLLQSLGKDLNQYTVLEGSSKLLESFRTSSQDSPFAQKLNLVHTYFETFDTDHKFDAIEMGFVLEHVDDPRLIVERFSKLLTPGGILYIAVPNANSLHRQLGYNAGYLKDLTALSEADLELGHQHYFNLQTLTTLVHSLDLHIISQEGIFLKPFSTGQLRSLQLPEEILNALYETGVDHPDMCNAILLEVRQNQ